MLDAGGGVSPDHPGLGGDGRPRSRREPDPTTGRHLFRASEIRVHFTLPSGLCRPRSATRRGESTARGAAKVSSFGRGGLHLGIVCRPPSPRRRRVRSRRSLKTVTRCTSVRPQSGEGAARCPVSRRSWQAQAWMPKRSQLRESGGLEGRSERPASGATGSPGRHQIGIAAVQHPAVRPGPPRAGRRSRRTPGACGP